MANYSIKTDLLKVKGAFVTNIKGKTATKRCLCIPLDESGLFLGQKGCYLNLTAIEMQNPQYSDTHCIKVAFDKEVYDKMTEEEKKAQPIIGGMHVLGRKQDLQTMEVNTFYAPDDDDLPF